MSAARTSLQSLQSLEKDFGSLDEQLEQLRNIIQLDISARAAEPGLHQGSARRYHGREEWAIRWLLKKLHAPGESGTTARSSHNLWTILANLILIVPPLISAKSLTSYRFLDSLEMALQESFAANVLPLMSNSDPMGATNVGAPALTTANGTKAELDLAPPRAEKRKRRQETQSRATSKRLKSCTSNPHDLSTPDALNLLPQGLLISISHFLQALLRLSINAEDPKSGIAVGTTSPIFRTSHVQAAKILGTWLRALASLEPWEAVERPNPSIAGDAFTAVLRIWENRSADLSSDSSSSFAEHCLAPAAIILKNKSSSAADRTVIEQLVAKNIFFAAKSIFIDKTPGQNSDADQGSSDPPGSLSQLLDFLRRSIQGEYSVAVNQEEVSSRPLGSTIPLLFDIAVRCTPLRSPRRRVKERPWLEHVFIELSSCLGLDMKDSNAAANESQLKLLTDMLGIARRNRLKFSYSTVKFIASNYCGLTTSTSKTSSPNWTAVAHILALDANVFLRNVQALRTQGQADKDALDGLLIFAISDHSFRPEGTMSFDTALFHDSEYNRLKNEVVIPLLQAYSSARDTPGFLKQWHRGLRYFDQNDSNRDAVSIWEDWDVLAALAQVLESSTTSSQTSEAIEEYAADFQVNDWTAISKKQFKKISSNAVLLTALLNGIQSDGTKAMVLSRVFEVRGEALALLKVRQTRKLPHRSRLWRLVASAHRLWASTAKTLDSTDILLQSSSLARGILLPNSDKAEEMPVEDTLQTMNFYERAEALACVGSMLNDVRSRNWNSDGTKQISTSLLEDISRIIKDNLSLSAASWNTLGQIIASYPVLLEFESKGEIREEILFQLAQIDVSFDPQAGGDIKQLKPASPWMGLIRRSLHDTTWLLDDIIKVISGLGQKAIGSESPKLNGTETAQIKELSYLQIPSSKFSRAERKSVLNDQIEAIRESGATLRDREWSQKLSLMIHMMTVIPGEAGLGIPLADILMIANNLDTCFASRRTHNQSAENVVAVFKELVQLSLRHDLQVTGKVGAEALFLSSVQDLTDETTSRPLDFCRLAVLSTILDLVPLHLDASQLQQGSQLCDMEADICSRFCEQINKTWTACKKPTAEKGPPIQLLQRLVDILAKLQVEALRAHQFAVHGVGTIVERAMDQSEGDLSELMISNYKLSWKVDASDPEALTLDSAYKIVQSGLPPHAAVLLQDFLYDAFSILSEEQRIDKLRDLLDECQYTQPQNKNSRWQVLQMLALSNSQSKPKARPSLIPVSETSSILIRLACCLPQSSTIQEYHFIASTLTTLVRKNTSAITQPTIEAILLSTVSVLSPASSTVTSIPSRHGPSIFTSQTTILRALLTHHRRRLRGRFNLVIPALQSLLRRLFHLPGSPRRSNWSLAAKHAESFTRLVTALCDPSVSAVVADRSAHRHLTDETRKARTYAGQYVPALLLTLCDLQLRGRFAGEAVREALAPGVFAMFDAMGKEVLGATNEGLWMPGGVRTVLRQWWDAWRRERGQ